MRAILLSLALVAVFGAGCIGGSDDDATDETVERNAVDELLAEPAHVDWPGYVAASPLGVLAHNRDTEQAVAPIQSEGFVFEITEVPDKMEVAFHWDPSPGGEVLIMVSSPRNESAPGLEFFSASTSDEHVCIQVPPEELSLGQWQVMVHTQRVVDAEFTFTVTSWGGAGEIVPGPHSAAEAAETAEADSLECEGEPHEH